MMHVLVVPKVRTLKPSVIKTALNVLWKEIMLQSSQGEQFICREVYVPSGLD